MKLLVYFCVHFSYCVQVKTPTIFLLGAKDLRVPVSNGLQVRILIFRLENNMSDMFVYFTTQDMINTNHIFCLSI